MAGGFESKPGGGTLVHDAAVGRDVPATPGKHTLAGSIQLKRATGDGPYGPDPTAPLQRKPAAAPGADAPATAAAGTGAPMEPGMRNDMERSFGSDFGSVRVHQDGAAGALGARAFTRGEAIHVAPGEYDPANDSSRRLMGHELAHVVQQRAGRVSTPQGFGGLGINDDPGLEAEADHAGDRAARGEPAGMTASGGGAPTHAPIQAKLRWSQDLSWLNAQTNAAVAARFATLAAVEAEADQLSGGVDIDLLAGVPAAGGAAHFSFKQQQVVIRPMPASSDDAIKSLSGADVNDRAISLAHELRHVCDAFQKDDPKLRSGLRKSEPWEELIHTEWRAHATQAKAAIEIANQQGASAVPDRHRVLIDRWKTNTFDISQAEQPQAMFAITKSYIWRYSEKEPANAQVDAFIKAHADWVAEAFAICPPRDTGGPP